MQLQCDLVGCSSDVMLHQWNVNSNRCEVGVSPRNKRGYCLGIAGIIANIGKCFMCIASEILY